MLTSHCVITLNDVRFGYNKDGNGLATVKLLTLYDTTDHQPVACTRQPENIPDATSVLNTLKQLSALGMDKPLLVLDGGFFSEGNILLFLKSHLLKWLNKMSVAKLFDWFAAIQETTVSSAYGKAR